jgi:hypothetical protein
VITSNISIVWSNWTSSLLVKLVAIVQSFELHTHFLGTTTCDPGVLMTGDKERLEADLITHGSLIGVQKEAFSAAFRPPEPHAVGTGT